MYPLTGNVAAHVGGVQASLLAAQRLVYRLHRLGIAWGTFGSGALCGRYPMPVMKKSQYRWQMTQPVPGDDAVPRLQPDRTVLGALGNPARAARPPARVSATCCGENATVVSSEPFENID